MYTVIARKYRPQSFSEVVNQDHIKQTLRNAIEQARIAHGYIFAGQRGTGKTTMARLLAKALNCAKGPTPDMDLVCDSCREIAAGTSVDVIEIDAASNRGIDDIRGLRENVRYAPARDRYKFFIIDEAHQLTREAWNALLKTLEEPPPHVIFVLCTTEAHAIPTTIASRCQTFAFHNLGFEETVKQLQRICASEGIEAGEEALAVMTQAAEGSLRDALSALDQAIACCGTKLEVETVRQLLGVVPSQVLEEVVGAVLEGSAERMLALVEGLVREGHNLRNFCGQLSRHFRNLLVARTAGNSPQLIEAPRAERERLAAVAQSFSEEDLARYLQIVLRMYDDLHHSPQPRFHTELGLLKLVHARRLVPIEELLAKMEGGGSPPGGSPPPGGPRSGPTPFERDLARRGTQAASSSAVPASSAPPPEPAAPRSEFATQVIRRVEALSRPMLAVCLEKAVSWEVTEGTVCASFAGARGGVHLPSPEDQRLLAKISTELLGRPVSFRATTVAENAASAAAASRAEPPGAATAGDSEGGPAAHAPVSERIRNHPEVAEFLRLFPGAIVREETVKD